jgi:hypothetical protein
MLLYWFDNGLKVSNVQFPDFKAVKLESQQEYLITNNSQKYGGVGLKC